MEFKTCHGESEGGKDASSIDERPNIEDEIVDVQNREDEISIAQRKCENGDKGCEWVGNAKEVGKHGMACLYNYLVCVFCKISLLKKDFEEHFNKCNMNTEGGKCIYKGCYFQAATEDLLKDHYQKEAAYHSHLYLEMESNLEKEKEDLKKMLQKGEASNVTPEQIQCNCDEKQEKLVQDKQHLCTKGISESVEDIKRKMSDLDLRQQLSSNASYDGRLLWKIDNILKRLEQAKTGRVTALHSAPVFTERYGYKFCGRVYLNGDGLGKCTHVSIFIVVMKSDYDNILQWPFHKQVTIGLLNQDDRTKDIIESFETDPSSSSFKKPTRDMNVAAGCPLFVKKENLLTDGFVKDDSIFIDISVSADVTSKKAG